MQNEVTVQESNPDQMIRYALEKNASVEQLEKLLALKERYDASVARQAYHNAMAAFKADPPRIQKDKRVGFSSGGSKVGYAHASLGNVTESINSGLSKHGLSSAWTVAQTNGQISVTTRITHKLGHSEETTLTAPADNSGAKNGIQAIGSTITYLERYGLLALTGLATYEQDDDGQAAVTVFVDEKELSQLVDLISDCELSKERQGKFLEFFKIESLEKMPKTRFNEAVNYLQAAKKQGARK